MSGGFLVVTFTKTNEVEVVPRVWITENGGKYFTYWPHQLKGMIYKAAESQEVPNSKTWKKFSIRILREFESYDEAVLLLPKFCIKSDLSDEDVENPNSSTINESQINEVQADVESSDDESPSSIPYKFSLTPVMPAPPASLRTSTGVLSKKRLHMSPTIDIDSPALRKKDKPDHVAAATHYSSAGDEQAVIRSEFNDFKDSCLRNFAVIKAQQTTLLSTCDEILRRMNCDESLKAVAGITKDDLQFPFDALGVLTEFDLKIKTDLAHRSQAVKVLSRVGGENVVKATNAIMKALMTDKLMARFTYFGTAEKLPFSPMAVNDLIFEAVIQNTSTSNATMDKVKEAVQTYLQHASDRLKYKRISMEKKSKAAVPQ